MAIKKRDKIYKKFSNCITTKGYARSIVIDIQRKSYLFIPNDIIPIIEKDFFEISELNSLYKTGMDYLIDNEIIFQSKMRFSEMFPLFNIGYDSSSYIENSIIDISQFDNTCFRNIVSHLDDLLCKALQLRIYKPITVEILKSFLEIINTSSIESLEVFIPYNEKFTIDILESMFINNYKKITLIYIFNANENNSSFIKGSRIYFSKDLITTKHCGQISKNLFTVNVQFTTLSLSYNTCLYKKISIDSHGNIKNCPSCTQSFGNIKDTTLEQALNHPDFKKYWNITKDQIDVCKDCEFRHMCTDCRVFIKDPENIYSQPAKCTYNPYIAKWQGEEGYVPVEECGTYTRKTGFVPNKERIAELNKEIWGD